MAFGRWRRKGCLEDTNLLGGVGNRWSFKKRTEPLLFVRVLVCWLASFRGLVLREFEVGH